MKQQGDPEKGDLLKVRYKSSTFSGIYIGNEKDILILKLENGYNVSLPTSSITILDHERREVQSIQKEMEKSTTGNGETRITIITTGGTIASRVDYSTGAVKPVKDLEFLSSSLPGLVDRFTLELSEYGEILSENMKPENWISLARSTEKLMKKTDGVVITHGTDTMSYTASALAFMFEKQTAPIIFVGSQRSSDRPSSDAFLNFRGAIEFSSTDFGEVGIAMHETISDSTIDLHRSVRSRKMHTSRRDAFKTIGSQPIGRFHDGNIFMEPGYRKTGDEIIFSQKLDSKVALVYFSPTLTAEDLENMSSNRKAMVLMGTGLGHVSTDLISSIRRLVKDGFKIMMASQCIHGSVDMNVYSTGRLLQEAGIIPLGSMIPEVAYVKSMYALANFDLDDFEKIMSKNLRGEIADREISSHLNSGGY